MKKIYCFLLIIVVFLPSMALAASLDVRINSSLDDVEQSSNGSIVTNSSDLELVYDSYNNRGNQIVGLRFHNVAIPPDSVITEAHIRFASDERTIDDCSLSIYGEAHSDAAPFTTSNYNVSSRTKTAAHVSWSPGRWNNDNSTHDTPDLKSIVQEIIGISGWNTNSEMVFIISGTGVRTAESYDGESWSAPLLHVEYEEAAPPAAPEISVSPVTVGSDAPEGSNAPQRSFVISNIGDATLNYEITEDAAWLSCSPTTGSIAAGNSATITVSYATSALTPETYSTEITISDRDGVAESVDINATVRITPVLTGSVCGDVPVYTENLVSPAILLLLDVSGSMGWDAPLAASAQTTSQTPDISSIVQTIVSRENWLAGNAMSFFLTATDDRVAVSRDNASDLAPLLPSSLAKITGQVPR